MSAHAPRSAFRGDLLYCSCNEPDWDSAPPFPTDPADLDAWEEKDAEWLARQPQALFQPEDYVAHVEAAARADELARIAEPARVLLDVIRSNWTQVMSEILSPAMCALDDAIGNPPARNAPHVERQEEEEEEEEDPCCSLYFEWDLLDHEHMCPAREAWRARQEAGEVRPLREVLDQHLAQQRQERQEEAPRGR